MGRRPGISIALMGSPILFVAEAHIGSIMHLQNVQIVAV
jgi:hypothetical protein